MQILKNNKTFVYQFGIPVWILSVSILLSACSSEAPAPAQTDPNLTPTQRVETSPADLRPSQTPSNSVIPEQHPIVPVETHEGVSIAVTWAYADSARIGIEYRIRGIKIPEGYHLYCPVGAVSLKDDSGKEYEKYIWPPDERPSENFEIQCKQTGNEYIVTQNYYGAPANSGQPLGLTLSIDLGGFEIYTPNGLMKEFPKSGPFTFHFDVPITSSLTLDPNMTQSKNGMTVTLNRLAITPTVTDAYLCISYENHKGWHPDITLTWEDKVYKADEIDSARMDVYHKTFTTYMSQFTAERCYRYSFFVPYDQEKPGAPSQRQMVVTLNKLVINAMDALSQEDCAASLQQVQRIYPELDFSCNINNSDPQGLAAGININKTPSGMDLSTAYQIAEESFKSVVEGPFTFALNVP